MTMNEYQQLAQRTTNSVHYIGKIENGCMGLCGESGECMDVMKKHMFQGHDLDKEKLIEELGDVLWYAAELASGLRVSLDDVAQRNIDKLRKRYPEGFEAERSINREE